MALSELKIRRVMSQYRPAPIKCDLCGVNKAQDRHHIIPRRATMGNERESEIANGPYLTSLLCRTCHDTADTDTNRNRLFQRLYQIYGRGNCEAGYTVIKREFDKITATTWEIPDVNNEQK